MFKATVNENRISVTNPDKEIITSGSVNVNFIEFDFTNDWLGLQKTVIFQTKKAIVPILLEEDKLVYQMPIPWEVLLSAGESINVGVYGTRLDDAETFEDEEIVLPTVWGTIPEKIRQGVVVSDPIQTSPTYNSYMELLDIINKIIDGETESDTIDHRILSNRNAENQHPIDAISGLSEELARIPGIMTSDELRKILMS